MGDGAGQGGAGVGDGMFFFCAGVQALSVRAEVTGLGDTHNANPSTLGVLHFLLVVEGQGGYPRDSWIRRQVCSADAGVCYAWKAAGEGSKDLCVPVKSKEMPSGRKGLAHEPRDRDGYRMGGAPVDSAMLGHLTPPFGDGAGKSRAGVGDRIQKALLSPTRGVQKTGFPKSTFCGTYFFVETSPKKYADR